MPEQQHKDQVALLIALNVQQVNPPEFTLRNEVSTIGREPGCDVVVQRREVSRLHARVERQGLRYILIDANSSNGTYVNGRRLNEPHSLENDDLIGLGSGPSLLKFIDPLDTFVPSRGLRYDDQLMVFLLDGRALELTPGQAKLLLMLYRNTGRLCTRDECAQQIWGQPYEAAQHAAALDMLVAGLRARIRQADADLDLIKTRRGLGYVLEQ
ncbi:FHA domain-containing protein [Chloroflexales bacterium ZM16-3]|nr:FHA domain-containing protein [Chloroflexales bacterium ZM16-3]